MWRGHDAVTHDVRAASQTAHFCLRSVLKQSATCGNYKHTLLAVYYECVDVAMVTLSSAAT